MVFSESPILSLPIDVLACIVRLVNGYDVANLYLTGNGHLRNMMKRGGAKEFRIQLWPHSDPVWPLLAEELDQLEVLVLIYTHVSEFDRAIPLQFARGVPSLKRLTIYGPIQYRSEDCWPHCSIDHDVTDYRTLFSRLEHLETTGEGNCDFFSLLPSTLTSLALKSAQLALDDLRCLPSTLISLDISFSPVMLREVEALPPFPPLLESLTVIDIPTQKMLLKLPESLLSLESRQSCTNPTDPVSALDVLPSLPAGLKSLIYRVRHWGSKQPFLTETIALALPRHLEVLVVKPELASAISIPCLGIHSQFLEPILNSLPRGLKQFPLHIEWGDEKPSEGAIESMMSLMANFEYIESLDADQFCSSNNWIPPKLKEMTTSCERAHIWEDKWPSSLTQLTFLNCSPPLRLPPHLKSLILTDLFPLNYISHAVQFPALEVFHSEHFPLQALPLLPASLTEIQLQFSSPCLPAVADQDDAMTPDPSTETGIFVIDLARFSRLKTFACYILNLKKFLSTQHRGLSLMEVNLPPEITSFSFQTSTLHSASSKLLPDHACEVRLVHTGWRTSTLNDMRLPSYYFSSSRQNGFSIARRVFIAPRDADSPTMNCSSPRHSSFRVPIYAMATTTTSPSLPESDLTSYLYRVEGLKTIVFPEM